MFFSVPENVDRRHGRGHSQSWCICLAIAQPQRELWPSGETVLILPWRDPGVTGQASSANRQNLGRRDRGRGGGNGTRRVLGTLLDLGADATIRLDKPDQELIESLSAARLAKKRFRRDHRLTVGGPFRRNALLTPLQAQNLAVAGIGDSNGGGGARGAGDRPDNAARRSAEEHSADYSRNGRAFPPWDVPHGGVPNR